MYGILNPLEVCVEINSTIIPTAGEGVHGRMCYDRLIKSFCPYQCLNLLRGKLVTRVSDVAVGLCTGSLGICGAVVDCLFRSRVLITR